MTLFTIGVIAGLLISVVLLVGEAILSKKTGMTIEKALSKVSAPFAEKGAILDISESKVALEEIFEKNAEKGQPTTIEEL